MKKNEKRLITLFDEKLEIELFDSDIIFTNNNLSLNCNSRIYTLDYLDDTDTDEKIFSQMQAFMDSIPEEFEMLKNDIYVKIFRPVVHVLFQIQKVIQEENIIEIILNGGSRTQFLSLNCAEGEGNKSFYRSSWLLNYFIEQFYKNDETLKIVWNKRKSSYWYQVLFEIRESYFAYRKILTLLLKRLIQKNYNCKLPVEESGKKTVLVFADLELQYIHMRRLLKQSRQYKPVYILNRHINRLGEDITIFKGTISIHKLFQLTRKIYGRFSPEKLEVTLLGKSIPIELNNILKGALASAIQALSEQEIIYDILKKCKKDNIQCILTDKTIGQDICAVHSAAQKSGIVHINIQFVAMAKVLYPKLNLADKYYLYTQSTYELYRNHSEIFNFYIPMEPKEQTTEVRDDKTLRITVFTQPDGYTDRYLIAIQQILQVLNGKKNPVEVNIKLHYRQNKVELFEKFKAEFDGIEIQKEGNAGDEIRRSDFIMSMTSSVLFEAVINRIPALIINFDKKDEKLIFNSEICLPQVNYVLDSPKDLLTIINSFSAFRNNYEQKLNEYLNTIGGGTDIDEWLKL